MNDTSSSQFLLGPAVYYDHFCHDSVWRNPAHIYTYIFEKPWHFKTSNGGDSPHQLLQDFTIVADPWHVKRAKIQASIEESLDISMPLALKQSMEPGGWDGRKMGSNNPP